MVKLKKMSIEKSNAIFIIDDTKKTMFPVYYKNKIAIYIKFTRKDNNASIIYYYNDVKKNNREELKDIFDIAVEVINQFDVSFNLIHQKGALKENIKTRDYFIKNNIPFVGYAGEASIPYQTDIKNSECIVGKINPLSTHKNTLDIHLFIKSEKKLYYK